jgi:hypothetical protein
MVFNTNVIMPRGSSPDNDPIYALRTAERGLFAAL